MEDNKVNTFACWCALPALNGGSTECCKHCPNNPNRKPSDKFEEVVVDRINVISPEEWGRIKSRLDMHTPGRTESEPKYVHTQGAFPTGMYNVIADEEEMRWFFDHVIQKPQVNESYSSVFVCRHKKLTKEEQETIGLTRRESEFLATQTFRLASFKTSGDIDDSSNWTFGNFLKRVKRFNVDKGAYTTAFGDPIPEKTLAVIFYVNPCDDIKVVNKFFEEYQGVTNGILKAHLGGKNLSDDLQSYQWFGNAESTIKHLRANQKGSRYWMDFDVDVPKWFKEGSAKEPPYIESQIGDFHFGEYKLPSACSPEEMREWPYFGMMKARLSETFGKGNYVIVDTSGGYHILVRTSSIHSNPHDFCKMVSDIYELGLKLGEEPYVDENGNRKFECIVNDSQIPGLPLPGTYQYGRPVTVLNKEDFE